MSCKLKIEHKIDYLYQSKVFLEPHTVRLIPKTERHCRVLSYNISFYPEPAQVRYYTSTDGAILAKLYFSGMTDVLSIFSESEIEITEFNPFDFIVYPELFLNLPFDETIKQNKELSGYIKINGSKNVLAFTENLAIENDFKTLDFLNSLLLELNREIQYITREDGHPFLPEKTLSLKKGSCRDITALFIEACRIMNIPAKFVSGYYYPAEPDNKDWQPELHCWAEVFIPGAGWIGYDATYGILCCGRHIALVTSALQNKTLPVAGSIRGTASSIMNTATRIVAIP